MKILFAVALFCLFFFSAAYAENLNLWHEIAATGIANKSSVTDFPVKRRAYRADNQRLREILSRVEMEGRVNGDSQIELPVQNGEIQLFSIEESPVMAAGLAAKYNSIKTYKIEGIDDPASSGRLSFSPKGLFGMITGPSGTLYIDAKSEGIYSAYSKARSFSSESFHCGVKGHHHDTPVGLLANRPSLRNSNSLKVYRLALAATSEYISAVGGTNIQAHEAIVIAVNRVNQIYQRDLGIKLELIDDNDLLLESGSNLPVAYTNDDESAMLDQNQLNIDGVIGTDNYDIGHVFGTGGGGIAEVGSVCTSVKAGGATGLYDPTGDAFYIDYVAHEMGHQFSAEHTFNGSTLSCGGGNRWQATAFEPGGGSTIMSYAGICGAENIVNHADAMFHSGSIDLIESYISTGAGASCGHVESINNPSIPTVEAGNDYTIPHKTPFRLIASGYDQDKDPLTYTWDQMDAGRSTDDTTIGTDLGNNSLFRSYLPRSENYRDFPALGTTLQNKYDYSENLACKDRSLNFRVTIRDGISGISSDNIKITVDNASGPFKITSFNDRQSLSPGAQQIYWDTANTENSPVNCSNVDISLLTFNSSKTSYAETDLATNVTNNGHTTVNIPDVSSSRARLKIQCSHNIFYDISDADLIINGQTDSATTGNTVFYNSSGLLITSIPSENCVIDNGIGKITDSLNDNSASVSIYWIFSLLTLLAFRWIQIVRKI